MKAAIINKTHIEGLLYEHKLENKISGPQSKNPGTPFISGSIDIATDDAGVNIITVNFTYVTAKTAAGKDNQTFVTLQNIIDGKLKSVMTDGKDVASKLKIDSAIGLNEWYKDELLISQKRNENGFVHSADSLNQDEGARNTFETDMIITNIVRVDADEEKNTPEKVVVKGAIFNFRKELLPVEFSVLNPKGMDYFESLEVSNANPIFTKVWGKQVSETIKNVRIEENAFGEDHVIETERTKKDFVITGTSTNPYEWDTKETILASELKEMIAARETHLATLKQRQEEYRASKGGATAVAPTGGDVKKGQYDF